MAASPSRRTSLRARIVWAVLAVLGVLIGLSQAIAVFYTDLQWFRDVGQESVFWTRIYSEWAVGAAFGFAAFLVVAVNIIVARRMRPQVTRAQFAYADGAPVTPQQQLEEFLGRARETLEPYVRWLLLGLSVVIGWNVGAGMAGDWEFFRLGLAGGPFGVTDPQFGVDVGFFVFRLPALVAVNGWIGSTLAIALVVTLLVHLYDGGIRPSQRFQGIDAHVKAHISVLLGLIVASQAFGDWLKIYELDLSPRGQVLGASYTDVHAQLPAYWILIVIAILTGVLLMVNIRYRGWRLPAIALGVWVAAAVLVGGVYPAIVQQLIVSPNELVQERPYIKRNIESTRRAFDLEAIDATGFPAAADLSASDLGAATATVSNIRLWDPNIVIDTYKQLQEIRFYYDFKDVDIDRYVIDGVLQQVLISAREMNVDQLSDQAKTWVNQHLVYTHGYGAVVSPVNQVSPEGLPVFMVRDLPPKTSTDLKITRPGIYFGEETNGYAIVDTRQKEFDYPVGGENAVTSYAGKNGVPVGSLIDRLAFAMRTGDVEVLFSTAITGDSRILFRRTITDRVRTLAPWLLLDGDPYPVVVGGRIVWVLDGYTWSSYYPYSQRYTSSDVNYIRNSVKVTVDAYDGTTTFYAFDDKDPVLAAYRSIFPTLVRDGSEMPADIRAHLRFPEDLFRLQAQVYKTYHMLDPTVFYNKEDQWALPGEAAGDAMAPFYVLMGLPGETGQDFLLMEPFTPRNKDNMIGWMAVKSDPGAYGQRIVFNFPKQRLILGPQQVKARLNQEPDISKELTLLNQQGSSVRFGNLLVIPIKDSIVYVQPLYLQAQQSPMPELKRVIVAYADRIAMAPDLGGALQTVFGGAPATGGGAGSGGATGTVAPPAGATAGIAEARALYEKAVAAQKAGDWAAYGGYLRQLGQVLGDLAAQSKAATGTR